ncbi:hypothetical protein A1O1_03325 [Capronia coronata CBS 617.96]|uniref:CENP-V/GFA domain-containing protein n=1 Tax=Capronia coronata CBS 617.96 TaxID=1182541 RepID=W9YLV3_9EURO|nr:uncharacterized protein A1O1_03325 [Capronia coronata CBS 617.96]EXJ90226.1 hypothetical protein A1O1_03325 [Capronia coronata CBS 617.96]
MATPTRLTCLCKLVYEPADLLSSSTLPLECTICHCDTCRYTTGGLGVSCFSLKGRPSDKSLSNTTAYKTSEKYTRFFCKHCGCNVFFRSEEDGQWLAFSGIIEPDHKRAEEANEGETGGNDENVARVTSHIYVGDAHDGGMAPFLTRLGGRKAPCYVADAQDGVEPLGETELQELRGVGLDVASHERGSMMDVACHCGGVQLQVVPPAYNESSEGWHVPPDRSKYYARVCCCRSCRLALGFSLQPWAYIPPAHILTKLGEPVVFGPKAKETAQLERLKHYQSSESVLRSFCTTCGATIFFQSFERPDIINVSAGVVRSTAGNALAREWLHWDRRAVSYGGEAVDTELVEAWLAD